MVLIIPRGADEGFTPLEAGQKATILNGQPLLVVVPAKAGIQGAARPQRWPWTPAFAGATITHCKDDFILSQAVKSVEQIGTANDSKNSLLLLAVLRCYSAAAVAKDAAFPRLRRTRWLLFCGLTAISAEPLRDVAASCSPVGRCGGATWPRSSPGQPAGWAPWRRACCRSPQWSGPWSRCRETRRRGPLGRTRRRGRGGPGRSR